MTVVALNTEAFSKCTTADEFSKHAFKLLTPHMEKIRVFSNGVVVLTYIPPSITKGGIHLSDTTAQESRFQGNIGLVLKKGSGAFRDNALNQFNGDDVRPGDWVWFWFRDAWEFSVAGYSLRCVPDALIRGTTDDPRMFYLR